MAFSRIWLVFSGVLFIASLPSLVAAAHNVTVDDSDTAQIVYSPPSSWKETPFDPLNAGGRHRVTSNPSATATFTFTGVSIYFYSPLWPFDVTTQISLDGAGPVVLQLIDPDTVVPVQDGAETVQSSVAWFAEGLDNVPHTFVVSVAPGSEHAIVDTFVYTVPDAGDPTTSVDPGSSLTTVTSETSSSTSSTSFLPRPSASATGATSSSSSPTAKKGLSIALGIVCTVFALLVLYGVYWYWRRRQRLLLEEQEEEEYRRNNPSTAENENSTPTMDYAYKRQPSTWQRNARGRLIAAPTGITTMIPTMEQAGNMNLSPGVGESSRPSASHSRGSRKGPRRHGPSPLSMTSTSSSSSSSSISGSPRIKGKNPLTTIPEMRMREDDAIKPSTAASSSSNIGDNLSPFADRSSSPRIGAGSTKWTTFDQNGS